MRGCRRNEWEITPWVRVNFPQKSGPFPRLSGASPSEHFCPLLLCAHGAPQQWDLLSAWRRHDSARSCVCARSCTRSSLYRYYFHTPVKENAKAQLHPRSLTHTHTPPYLLLSGHAALHTWAQNWGQVATQTKQHKHSWHKALHT